MDNDIFNNGAIEVYGARVHNLKNIDVRIPRDSLTVITGLSGCGKSSLAFDTILAEGRRRYIETFSAYARNMLGNLERPDVDEIDGLSPVISIEQKTVNKNPRSTIGTVTEIYDYIRLLFARLGDPVSYITGAKMTKHSIPEIISLISKKYDGRKLYILAPLIKNRKGHYKDLFEKLRKKGFLRARVDGEIVEMTPEMRLDRYKNHSIELVIDRLSLKNIEESRLRGAVEEALKQGEKQMLVIDAENGDCAYFSQTLMESETGLSYPEPAPHTFSFNSPQGACPRCKGLGVIDAADIDKIIPDKEKSIKEGAIDPIGKFRKSILFSQLEIICKRHGHTLDTPASKLKEECIDEILFGCAEQTFDEGYGGLVKYLELQRETETEKGKTSSASKYFCKKECPDCHGARLSLIPLHYFIDGKNIADIVNMDLISLSKWFDGLENRVSSSKKLVAVEILKEIRSRLQIMIDVGLGYLSIGRSSGSLSGGESQRIRLAAQIGSKLVGVLYILDEPSIGLHQTDNDKLINTLKRLRDAGNTVIVVEHDKDIMMQADYIVDIGPEAGENGGEVVYQGSPAGILGSDTLTAQYLSGRKNIDRPSEIRTGNGKTLSILGASGHNLKNIDLHIPLGKFVCVSGVSGSGKSSLITNTLQPLISKRLYGSLKDPLPFNRAQGLENIDKIVTVDQSPIGRTPRSNPATYTQIFSEIRNLFVSLPESKLRGYKPGRFSFNVSGGRCETCKGSGYRSIEMHFLPDVLVPCEQCRGKRYNRETLEIRYKGKSISDILDMTVDSAVDFFSNIPSISRKVKMLQEVGLGYITLGQPSSTLSGGENQRVKLAAELAKRDTGNTLFILDEPTTGLHFEDIRQLLATLHKIVDRGNSLIVIEHNIDIIKNADHIIELGPGSGSEGGMIVAQGTPFEIAESDTPTSGYLRKEIGFS